MRYYNLRDGEVELTPEGEAALATLGVTLEELVDVPDDHLTTEHWRGCKTYVDQALKNGKGITWLDDCRVPIESDDNSGWSGSQAVPPSGSVTNAFGVHAFEKVDRTKPTGRFPANLLVSDEALNSHSKYFDLDAWADTLPFLAVPKASKSEKNAGLHSLQSTQALYASDTRLHNNGDGTPRNKEATTKNHHPTVKPLKLMSYLITLTTREGDTVLDPFVGSGTTVVAAKQLGRIGIGIEREQEYAEIAQARYEHAKEEKKIVQTTLLD